MMEFVEMMVLKGRWFGDETIMKQNMDLSLRQTNPWWRLKAHGGVQVSSRAAAAEGRRRPAPWVITVLVCVPRACGRHRSLEAGASDRSALCAELEGVQGTGPPCCAGPDAMCAVTVFSICSADGGRCRRGRHGPCWLGHACDLRHVRRRFGAPGTFVRKLRSVPRGPQRALCVLAQSGKDAA